MHTPLTLQSASDPAPRGEPGSLDQDEFLTLLSHELRTPLGALLAASDVLEYAAPGSPDDAQARAVIARQTRRLAQVLNQMIEIGRVAHPVRPPLN